MWIRKRVGAVRERKMKWKEECIKDNTKEGKGRNVETGGCPLTVPMPFGQLQ